MFFLGINHFDWMGSSKHYIYGQSPLGFFIVRIATFLLPFTIPCGWAVILADLSVCYKISPL